MSAAYKITYLGPTHTMGARLLFQNPKGERSIVPRNFELTAEAQAKKLAEATPGFKAIGALDGLNWIYIVEHVMKSALTTTGEN